MPTGGLSGVTCSEEWQESGRKHDGRAGEDRHAWTGCARHVGMAIYEGNKI